MKPIMLGPGTRNSIAATMRVRLRVVIGTATVSPKTEPAP